MTPVHVPTVARTMRAAIRIGEEYVTLEEVVTLPLDASDEDIAQAVALGMRIYQAQREAIAAQAASIRETVGTPPAITMRDPDSPASDKQRNYIATLQDTLNWSNERLAAYAAEQRVDLVAITKAQASAFIDQLKQVVEERATSAPTQAAAKPPPKDAAEAEQRFFARYGARIDGTDWDAVRRFLHMPRLPKPRTVGDWMKVAQLVNTRQAA